MNAEDIEQFWDNFPAEDLVRGSDIAGVDKRCLELCQTYIGGSWLNAQNTSTDVTVKRISGGLTNQLYHAQLSESVTRVSNALYPDEPSDVAIKIYQEKHIKNYNEGEYERLNDTIVLTIVSQAGLGPKVYGIFNDGFIQGFYKHEQFRVKQQNDPQLVQQLFTLLAKINHLDVPISKEPNKFIKEMLTMFDFAYANCRVVELSEELDLKLIKQRDLRDECDALVRIVDSLNIPIVFCHVDFRGSNLLVVTEPEQKIFACDFECCQYGYRGFDLAAIIFEWSKKYPIDMTDTVPQDHELERLIKIYVDAVDKLIPGYSKNPENTLAVHVREVKVMLLVNRMFFLALMIKQQSSSIPSIPFDAQQQMYYMNMILKYYYDYKELLIKDGIINV